MKLWSMFVLLLSSTAATAQSAPRDLADMVGARAGQAENELGRRGYQFVRAEPGDDRSYTFWWNAGRRQCVTIATMNGRYDSITATPAPDCRPEGSASSRPERWRSRPRTPFTGSVNQSDLSNICKGEAAAAFVRRPSEITTNLPIRQPSGVVVQGWFKDGRTRFFRCRFSPDGRFLSVN